MHKCKCKSSCKALVKSDRKDYARGHHPDCHKDYVARGRKIAKALTGRTIPQEVIDKILRTRAKPNSKFRKAMKLRSLNKTWLRNMGLARRGKCPKWKDPEGRLAKIKATHATRKTKNRVIAAVKNAWANHTPDERARRCKRIGRAHRGKPKGPMSLMHKKSISKGNRIAYKEGRHAIGGPNRWHSHCYKGVVYRSSYEVALVKYLNKQSIQFIYEGKTFNLGYTSYRPDFYIPKYDVFIETKGYAPKKFWKKIVSLHRLYPKVRILILDLRSLQRMGVM